MFCNLLVYNLPDFPSAYSYVDTSITVKIQQYKELTPKHKSKKLKEIFLQCSV